MRSIAWIAALLLLAPAASPAVESGYFDLFYAPRSDFRTASGAETDGGMGYGFQGRRSIQPQLFLTLEAYTDRYDGLDGDRVSRDLTWIRLGGGYQVLPDVDIRAQFLRGQSNTEADSGVAVHINAQTDVRRWWELTARVGWVSLRDTGDGVEWLAGAAVTVSDPLRLFVEHRVTTLEAGGGETRITDTMAGIRVRF
ncbi:MAG: hypothetical protein ACT4PK_03475 [Gammaproteobacteria bacterium]